MKLFVYLLVTICVAASNAEPPTQTVKNDSSVSKQQLKPKRDAALSIGGYHGPSHKYLPPSSAASGYSSYSSGGFGGGSHGVSHGGLSGGHASLGGSSHGIHGSYGGGQSGYIISGHAGVGGNGIGFSGGHGGFGGSHASLGGHAGFGGGYGGSTLGHSHGNGGSFAQSRPKIETYIVQTQHHGGQHSHQSATGAGNAYKYSGPVTFGSSSAGFGSHGKKVQSQGFGGAHTSAGLSHGGSYAYNKGSSSGGQHSISNTLGALLGHNLGHGGQIVDHGNSGYQYEPTSSTAGSSSQHGFGGHGPDFGQGSSSAGGYGQGGGHGHGLQNVGGHGDISGHDLGLGLDLHHGTLVIAGHEIGQIGHGSSGHGSTGYSYEAPSVSLQHTKPDANSYSVPINSVTSQESHQEHSGDDTPIYATGHKGLGHFGYTSNKPVALNTDFISSHKPSLSNAPFKPSTFLGSKIEPNESFSSISGEHGPPSAQYLPPSTGGYEYQQAPSPPASYYGAPANSGESAAPIYEPESNYLPPSSSQDNYEYSEGAPRGNYLPPNNQYGVPQQH